MKNPHAGRNLCAGFVFFEFAGAEDTAEEKLNIRPRRGYRLAGERVRFLHPNLRRQYLTCISKHKPPFSSPAFHSYNPLTNSRDFAEQNALDKGSKAREFAGAEDAAEEKLNIRPRRGYRLAGERVCFLHPNLRRQNGKILF